MIELYAAGNEDFTKNGNITLTPLSCIVTANLNQDWTLTIEHPLDEMHRYEMIQNGAVIKAPSFNGKQLFRIYNTEKTDNGITALAYPIFLDAANDLYFIDKRIVDSNGQTALNKFFEDSKYTGASDIVKTSTAYYQNVNAVMALNGDIEQAFTSRWGGQIIYDNRTVIINERAGGDYGVTIEYGKNITGIQETISRDSLITRIIPQAYNGYMLDGESPWVDSPLIDKYPIVYTKVITFEDVKLAEDAGDDETGFETIKDLQAELVRRCNLMFSDECVDLETVTLDIDIILLENTTEYVKFKDIEKISLGDTVKCKHSKLGINTTLQTIALTYNCLSKKTENVKLGSFQPSFFNNVTLSQNKVDTAIRQDGTVNAEMIQGIISAGRAQFKHQNTAAKKQAVRCILFEDLDTNSPLYGALGIGTQGIQIANKRTSDGRDWDWKTAITATGVVSNYLIGEYIRGIAIEADKGKIGGFEITNTGLKKSWTYTNVDESGKETTYETICEISSETGSKNGNYLIKIYNSDDSNSYAAAISNAGAGDFTNVAVKNDLIVHGHVYIPQKVLWDGTYSMIEGHIAHLYETIDKQTNGIILVFSPYDRDYNPNFSYDDGETRVVIPKLGFGELKDYSVSQSVFCCYANFACVGMKHVIVYNDRIEGTSLNGGSGVSNGISYNNWEFVLRKVIGF